MYEIHFYKDKNGKEPVKEYIAKLAAKKDKDGRTRLNKISDDDRSRKEMAFDFVAIAATL